MLKKITRRKFFRSGWLLALPVSAALVTACGYPSPQGGGALTPYVVVVTPTALPATVTAIAEATALANRPPTATAAPTATPAPTTAPAAITAARPTPSLAVSGNTYTVKEGDSLYGIAIRLQVDLDQLIELNDIEEPSKIQIGQVLKLPPRKTAAPTTRNP